MKRPLPTGPLLAGCSRLALTLNARLMAKPTPPPPRVASLGFTPVLHWFKDHEADTDEKKPKYDLNIGSSWVPGISDGSHLMPDSARVRIEQDTDGVWRPARMA